MKNLVTLFLIFYSLSVGAQVKFEASTEKKSYALNENIELVFSMNVDADNFVLPQLLDNFKVQGPFMFVQNYNINGRRGFEKSYKYYLTPKKQGEFTIKEAQIEFGGKVYKTSLLRIKITKAVPISKNQNNQNNQNNNQYDPFDDPFFHQNEQPPQARTDFGDGSFIVAEVSNKNPYVNEPIHVVYKLYFDPRIQIGNITDIKKPKYNGFWSQFFDANRPAVEAQYKGKTYAMATLGSAILYPLEAGIKPIEPFSFEAQVQVASGRDVFGDPIYSVVQKRLSSGTQNITVKALPESGKPSNFSGAVGHFDFKVTPTKTILKGGESLSLNVAVSGEGNLKLFSLPKPEVPPALEMYEPQHQENVQTPLSGMSGTISDNYTIVPQYKGNYPIKALRFSYFDLKSKSYKTIILPQININVINGPDFAAVSKIIKDKTKEVNSNKIFASIKQKTILTQIDKEAFLGSNLFLFLFFIPLFSIPALVFAKKQKDKNDADFVGNRIKNSNRLAKKYLSEAKKQINNKELFYISLEKAMHNFLKAKLNIETFDFSKEKLSEILAYRNANHETIVDFINLTENCEIARYAPATIASMQQDFNKALEIISSLEKQIA